MSLASYVLAAGAGGGLVYFGGLVVKQVGWPAIKGWLEARGKRLAAKAAAKIEAEATQYESAFRSALVAELAPVMQRLNAVEQKVRVLPAAPAPAEQLAEHKEGGAQ